MSGSEPQPRLVLENFIGGKFVACKSHIDSYNPSTGEVYCSVPDSGPEEVGHACSPECLATVLNLFQKFIRNGQFLLNFEVILFFCVKHKPFRLQIMFFSCTHSVCRQLDLTPATSGMKRVRPS